MGQIKMVYDFEGSRVTSEDGIIHFFDTHELSCPDFVIENVVNLFNETNEECPIGSGSKIDDYLLNEEHTSTEDREIIVEGIANYLIDNK